MGLGVTGLANAGEILGFEYGSDKFMSWMEKVFKCLRDSTYRASALLAKEKGSFPLYSEKYLEGHFINTLPYSVIDLIRKHGIRNSHLTSIAPTGTISLVADNVSGGIEPVFSHYYDRTLRTLEGDKVERVKDYAYSKGIKGKTSSEIDVDTHVNILCLAQHFVDSACSKTCNVGDSVTYEEFKDVYIKAWKKGAKGITTFRASGKRFGILNEVKEEEAVEACFIDPETGQKECS